MDLDPNKTLFIEDSYAGCVSGLKVECNLLFFPKDIEILRNSAGKPYINPQASLEEVFADLGIVNSHVSIADEIDYVVAFVIIES